jgi:hypothetical protein
MDAPQQPNDTSGDPPPAPELPFIRKTQFLTLLDKYKLKPDKPSEAIAVFPTICIDHDDLSALVKTFQFVFYS